MSFISREARKMFEDEGYTVKKKTKEVGPETVEVWEVFVPSSFGTGLLSYQAPSRAAALAFIREHRWSMDLVDV
jgi:hypothetical protein